MGRKRLCHVFQIQKSCSTSNDTLFGLKDKLLSGGTDYLVSTFQANTVIPTNGILNSIKKFQLKIICLHNNKTFYAECMQTI